MITIRRLRLGEADLYRQVRLKALREAPYAFSTRYEDALLRSPESWAEQADGSADGPDRATFVALDEHGLPVGLGALYRSDEITDLALLRQVWVAPEYRGDGVAVALLDALFDWARENGFRQVAGAVAPENARAFRFYLRHGFRPAEPALADAEQGERAVARLV